MRTPIILGVLALSTCIWASEPDGAGLQTGTLPAIWKSSASNCLTTPDYQVHAYNDDFYILRETGCIDEEKPFMYLIFGQDKVLLEDTGAGQVHTAPFVMDLIAKWVRKKNHAPVSLIVIHSHSHGDHTAGDKEFQAMPEVQFVLASPPEIQKAAGIANWPTDLGHIDLGGGRIVDVVPIPGHDVASIALYDRRTGNLMTGDSLYPGRLYVPEAQIPTYTASAQRLADFVKDRPIAHVLGTHIEQSQVPYLDYGRHLPQPEEHPLELTRANVMELNYAFIKMAGKSDPVILPETSVYPRKPNTKSPPDLRAGSTMGLQAGKVPEHWMTGGPNCLEVPDWQVQEYNPDFYILRQSGCIQFEKPFLYLIFGDNKALLEDTGVPSLADKTIIPTAPVILDLMAKWAKRRNHAPVSLIVIHSHAHGDHVAADPQFQAMSDVQFIAATPAEISKATGIANWPTDLGKIDLGNRMIDIIPIPGHNEASIALYDRLTGNLMTGDSLYPGRLGVQDFAAFKASAQRLADFVSDRPIAHVLGTHIEQTSTPYLDYPRGTPYQPEEHSLALTRAHVIELNEAFIAMDGKPQKMAFPEFTVTVRAAPRPSAPPPSAVLTK
jgi:glyoxylase-like metal-dependent hydrolase (beta-lactamase superfamily II)